MVGFNFSQEELLTFFAVLVRYGTVVSVLPFVGDRSIPMPIKVLLSLAFSITLFPMLLARGQINPLEAKYWGATAGGIVQMVGMEALTGLILGFTAKMIFDTISFGANLTGTFMGFAAASTFDPHQESQTQVIAELQLALTMLLFLSLDGHHLMLRAALDSYGTVGMGRINLGAAFSARLVEISAQVIRLGIQLSAPVAISIFTVNVAFGVLAKAMPQMNVLVLSFAVTALIGLVVMLVGMPEFQGASAIIMGRIGDWMQAIAQSASS